VHAAKILGKKYKKDANVKAWSEWPCSLTIVIL
jgi:hypothetical protein